VSIATRLVGATEQLPAAAVVVANISLEAVLALPARIDAPVLVTSGYLAHEEPALIGYRRVARRVSDGWSADVHRRA